MRIKPVMQICATLVLTAASLSLSGQGPSEAKSGNGGAASGGDVNGREMFTLIPLGIVVLVLGIYPSLLLNVMTSSVNHLADFIAQSGAAAAMVP